MERYSEYMQLVLVAGFLISNTSFGMDALLQVEGGQKNKEFEQIVLNSREYHKPLTIQFPTKDTNSIEALGKNSPEIQEKIVNHAKTAKVLVHAKVREVCQHFLDDKRKVGTPTEKALYRGMTLPLFVERLIKCRPVVFYKPDRQPHQTVFRDGDKIPQKDVTKIANHKDNAEALKGYISNHEIELAAFVGVFSRTFFINSGDRYNCGEINFKNEPYQSEGFFAGLVGACFEAAKWLEYKYMVITQEQNTADHGYGLNACDKDMLAIHSKLYDDLKFPTYDEAMQDKSGRFIELDGMNKGCLFDKAVYEKCIELRVFPFLNEAHEYAKKEDKKAYVHVVGLGLGIWQIDERQVGWMIDIYKKIISENDLSSISDINFSWFEIKDRRYKDSLERSKREIEELGKDKNIAIHFSKRNPAAELTGDDKDKVLFAMYAWDANAAPGNEFRLGGRCLSSSGDSAAASCSTIGEVQNPWINPYLGQNIIRDFTQVTNNSAQQVVVTSDSEEDKDNSLTDERITNEQSTEFDDSSGLEDCKNPTPNSETTSSWNNNTKLLMIGGIGVTLVAALYYFFHDRIPAHWPALPKFSFTK